MSRTIAAIIPCLLFLLGFAAAPAAAQVPPFFGRGATIFDPEIGVVQSGIVNDVQATVSADRKYVTMTMRATNAQLLALHEFAFQGGNAAAAGFVGGAGAAGAGAGGNGAGGGGTGGSPSPSDRAPAPSDGRISVLDRPGMTLLGRVKNVSNRTR